MAGLSDEFAPQSPGVSQVPKQGEYAQYMRARTIYPCWPLLLAGLLLPCSSVPANAQSTIQICGVGLRIGMARDRVIEAVRSSCEVKRFPGNSDFWCARTPVANSVPGGYDGCHTLMFDGGLLTKASRKVATTPGDTVAAILNEVYMFVQQAKANGEAVLTSAFQVEDNDSRSRNLVFRVREDRYMELTMDQPIGSSGARSGITLTEWLDPPVAAVHK